MKRNIKFKGDLSVDIVDDKERLIIMPGIKLVPLHKFKSKFVPFSIVWKKQEGQLIIKKDKEIQVFNLEENI